MKRLLACLLALMLCASGALAAERTLSRFELYRHGEIMFDSYDIATLDGRLQLSVNGGDFRPVDDAVGAALLKVIEKYGMTAWDGFSGSTPYALDGEGGRVKAQLPAAGAEMDAGSIVMLYVDGAAADSRTARVPDVTSMSILEANRLIRACGLQMRIEGSGLAVSQSPGPDENVNPSTLVTVTFQPPSMVDSSNTILEESGGN